MRISDWSSDVCSSDLNKAQKARADGRFKDEIAAVTVKGRKGDTIVADDEYIRSGVTIDSVSGVRPAFKKDGTVTAANASGLNDGAAALVVMTREEAEKRGAPVLATIKSRSDEHTSELQS